MFQFRLSTMLLGVALWCLALGFLRWFGWPLLILILWCLPTGLTLVLGWMAATVLLVIVLQLCTTWLATAHLRTSDLISRDRGVPVPRETIDNVAIGDVFHVKHPFCHDALFHVKRADHQNRVLRKSGST